MIPPSVVKPLSHSNEPAEMLYRWFWHGATHQQQSAILNDASECDRAKLLEAMTPERRSLVMPLLRKPRK